MGKRAPSTFAALVAAACGWLALHSGPAWAAAPDALAGHCPPQWPTHCPHKFPVDGDCFAAGVQCGTVKHCPPESFARACGAGKHVECWTTPRGGNYGDCVPN